MSQEKGRGQKRLISRTGEGRHPLNPNLLCDRRVHSETTFNQEVLHGVDADGVGVKLPMFARIAAVSLVPQGNTRKAKKKQKKKRMKKQMRRKTLDGGNRA